MNFTTKASRRSYGSVLINDGTGHQIFESTAPA